MRATLLAVKTTVTSCDMTPSKFGELSFSWFYIHGIGAIVKHAGITLNLQEKIGIFSCRCATSDMPQTIEKKVVYRIRGNGGGWAFPAIFSISASAPQWTLRYIA